MTNYPTQPGPGPQLGSYHNGAGQQYPMTNRVNEEQKADEPAPPPYVPPQDAGHTYSPVSLLL